MAMLTSPLPMDLRGARPELFYQLRRVKDRRPTSPAEHRTWTSLPLLPVIGHCPSPTEPSPTEILV